MIKKIRIDELQIGMYIHDLNCGWMDHGFLRQRFLVKSETNLRRIHDTGVRELYIDTDRGLDIALAQTEDQVQEALEESLARVASTEEATEEPETSLAEERIQARRIQNEALGRLRDLTGQLRHGQPASLECLEPVAEDMVASVLRNQDALIGYSRLGRAGRYQLEHGVNVSTLMVALGRTLGLEPSSLRDIALGGLLHDLGKAFVPTAILDKPGRLTDSELKTMREHVARGFLAASKMPNVPKIALAIIAEHHERTDGSGYPQRRNGNEITTYGKMAAIVDVYDAITSDRVYNSALEPHEALRKLLEWSSHHFDPELVQHFIRCLGIYPIGTLVRLRSGRLGVVVESGRESPFRPMVRIVMDANQRRYLSIEDLDLSTLSAGSEEGIAQAEMPLHWGIDPVEILHLPSNRDKDRMIL